MGVRLVVRVVAHGVDELVAGQQRGGGDLLYVLRDRGGEQQSLAASRPALTCLQVRRDAINFSVISSIKKTMLLMIIFRIKLWIPCCTS